MNRIYFPMGNGISCFAEERMVSAIVNSSGNKKVGAESFATNFSLFKIPFFRGLVYFYLGLYYMGKSYFKGYELDDRREEDKNLAYKIAQKLNTASVYVNFFATLLLAAIVSFLLIGFLPPFLVSKLYVEGYMIQFLVSCLRFAFLYLFMAGLRFMPFMQEVYRFNGAINQGINTHKDEEIVGKSIFYPLNYLSFMTFAFLSSIFVVSLIPLDVPWYFAWVINFATMLGIIMLCYELLYLLSKTEVLWVRDLHIALSWLVCIKPTITHQEIMKVNMMEINLKRENTLENEKVPMSAVYAEMQTKLLAHEKYDKADVEWIIANVLDKKRAEIKLVFDVSEKQYRDIMRATDRRAKGEPLSSIFGFVDFCGLRIEVNKKVLSPRLETELLVEEVIKFAKGYESPEICDLCTGSGAIAIALASAVPNAKITGIDVSKPALITAESNAKRNGVKIDFIQSDLFGHLKKSKKFDIIVSNPPYIKSSDIEKLEVEVKKYDPRIALDGGGDGLEFYRKIAQEAPKKLKKNGLLFLEIGKGQKEQVRKILKNAGFDETHVVRDLNKIERIIYGRTGN